MIDVFIERDQVLTGAHHQELATTQYSCRGVFADQCIFSLNLSRIQHDPHRNLSDQLQSQARTTVLT